MYLPLSNVPAHRCSLVDEECKVLLPNLALFLVPHLHHVGMLVFVFFCSTMKTYFGKPAKLITHAFFYTDWNL